MYGLTITPEPKYFAKLDRVVSHQVDKYGDTTHSNTPLGTCSQVERWANTGKRAPLSDPVRMMNMDAIRSPRKSSAPPPLAQLLTASAIAVEEATTSGIVEDMRGEDMRT